MCCTKQSVNITINNSDTQGQNQKQKQKQKQEEGDFSPGPGVTEETVDQTVKTADENVEVEVIELVDGKAKTKSTKK